MAAYGLTTQQVSGHSLLWPASCTAYLALAGTTRHSRPHPLLLPCTDAYDSNIALYYPSWPATFKTWYDNEEFLYDYSNPGFRCGGALRHLHLCVVMCWVPGLHCTSGHAPCTIDPPHHLCSRCLQ